MMLPIRNILIYHKKSCSFTISSKSEAYEAAVRNVFEAHNAKEGDGRVALPLTDFTYVMYDHVVNLADSLKAYCWIYIIRTKPFFTQILLCVVIDGDV